MLTSITVDNYQSLHHVELELAPLTVIVGPSSSGKSAFTRALRMLTSNQRGASFITHGQKQCTVKASNERGTIVLKRGAENSYTLIPADPNAQQQQFTKLAQNVPEEVSDFIGIPAKDPLNYASQFDKPYLLSDASAGEVARILGALTNVSVIFEGAREANRRRSAHAATLRTREADMERYLTMLRAAQGITAQQEALDKAEVLLRKAAKATDTLNRLNATIAALSASTNQLRAAQQATTAPLPTEHQQRIFNRTVQLQQLNRAVLALTDAAATRTAAADRIEQANTEEKNLRDQHQQLIRTLGNGILTHWVDASLVAADGTIASPATTAADSAADYIAEVLA